MIPVKQMRFRRLTIRKKSRPRALFEGQIDSQDTLSAKHNKNTVDGSEIRRENHPTCMKPVVNNWDIYHTNWCRMSSINSINAKPSKTKKTTNNHQPNNTCHNWNIYIYISNNKESNNKKWIHLRPHHDKVLPDLPRRPGVHGWAKILTKNGGKDSDHRLLLGVSGNFSVAWITRVESNE